MIETAIPVVGWWLINRAAGGVFSELVARAKDEDARRATERSMAGAVERALAAAERELGERSIVLEGALTARVAELVEFDRDVQMAFECR